MSAALQGELGLQLLKLLISVAVVIKFPCLKITAKRQSQNFPKRRGRTLRGYPLRNNRPS